MGQNQGKEDEKGAPRASVTPAPASSYEAMKNNKKIAEFLSSVPILAKLSEEERSNLSRAAVERKFLDREDIIREGDEGLGFFVIKSGEVVVTKANNGKEHELGRLKAGDFFGEAALLQKGGKRGATVTALGPVVCFYLSRKHFDQLTQSSGKIQFAKRKAVAAEGGSVKYSPKRPDGAIQAKSPAQTALIQRAVKENLLFSNLEEAVKLAIIAEMYKMDVKTGTDVIVQGTMGDYFYVVESGNFDIFVHKVKVTSRGPGTCFGELALMYNAPRAATVTAVTDSAVWMLDRYTYRRVISDRSAAQLGEYVNFLSRVELLAPLATYEREKIAEALEDVSISAGTVVVEQGKEGDAMYIVHTGRVTVTKKVDGKELELVTLGPGDYFGERALVKQEPRAATVKAVGDVRVLKLDRVAFTLLLGPLEEIFSQRAQDYEHKVAALRRPTVDGKGGSPPPAAAAAAGAAAGAAPAPAAGAVAAAAGGGGAAAPLGRVGLADLKVVGTLGKGSFGHVQLVVHNATGTVYALKSVYKTQIFQTGQQGHILSEKRVMEQLDHPFLIRLAGTFKDKNKLYFLLEPCLGGELFSVLRERTLFDEHTARFYAACVVSAFEYMHSKNIVYRDLKPENLLLDRQGYLKVTDFGFAKDISGERTWTLCGTPDYLAPEIVAGKGHGKGVDWWTLGIFIYEMLASYPPFYDEDPMKTYAKIMQGVITFPSHFSKEAVDLVKKLLHPKHFKRLGVVKGGGKLVKKHAFFKDLDWDALYRKELVAPIIPTIKDELDLGNFDEYPEDQAEEFPPYVDDGSGWDADF